jgi:hypothetical protein
MLFSVFNLSKVNKMSIKQEHIVKVLSQATDRLNTSLKKEESAFLLELSFLNFKSPSLIKIDNGLEKPELDAFSVFAPPLTEEEERLHARFLKVEKERRLKSRN